MTEKISNKKQIQVVGVGGLILNKEGEILLTKRIELAFSQWNGKWGIPGGNVEFGENPDATLHRELKEELGIEVKIILNTPLVASKTIDLHKMIYHGIFLCFPCLIIKGKPTKESAEHSDLKWFKPAEIDFSHCIPLTEDFIKQFIVIKSFYNVS
jgi:8-oxo-dGTP diphosphatase